MIIAVDGSAASGKGTLSPSGLRRITTLRILIRAPVSLSRPASDHGRKNRHERDRIRSRRCRGRHGPRTDQQPPSAPMTGRRHGVRRRRDAGCQTEFRVLATPVCQPPANRRGAVLDGRDIGSVILPDADFKFFIDADIENARRRTKELQESGQSAMFRDVLRICKTVTGEIANGPRPR